ncbi:MAG: Beta-lactamase class A [Parcubacteria group bacterium GW2011_GWA2_49_9]|nr:MAG: Beta-lactamase class A [Parcubacteria group bacterium GW2011_GWA2_49_9]
MQNCRSRFAISLGCAVFFGAGIAGGWFLRGAIAKPAEPTIFREPSGKYKFIDPLIGFNVGEKDDFKEYGDLEKKLRTKIDTLKKAVKVHSVSVYFRDMENAHWTGVNEGELYSPASLYKVALMIAVLKQADSDSSLLKKELSYTGSKSPEKPDYPPMTVGKAYTIEQLLTRLIALSDNDAKAILRDRIGQEAVSAVFADLRLSEPALSETGDSMSARLYSRFFRALYNATYLSRVHSEYALSLLSQAEFKSGIVNGLPPEARTLTVAHKFGYRVIEDPTDTVTEEIHDCGIVYTPTHPYFVCVMTKGWKQTDLLDTIQLLSRLVYEETTTTP